MKYILILLTCIAFTSFGQKYSIVNGAVKFQGVDATNPVLYDNDMVNDTPDIFYLWLKANRKEVNLVGNVNTRDLHPGALSRPHDNTFNTWMKFYNSYVANGMKNVPTPVKGASRYFNSSSIETSPGSELILTEARKASSSKPLVIIVGGQATSVANAFAKDRSIGPKIIVFHVDGYGDTDYNAVDDKAVLELVNGGVTYVNWDGNLNSWYNKAGSPMYSGSNKMPGINLNGLPNNSFANELRNNWFNQAFAQWGDIGDAPPIFYFFNHSLWQNVARKNLQNQTVTSDNYAFLLVSQNKWNDYGPQLNSYVTNPTNYIPVTTIPPVEPPVDPPVTSVGLNYFNIRDYGAKDDGSDSRAAIQAAIDDCILNRGTLYIPNSNNGYTIRGTLYIQPKAPNNQAFIDVISQGHYGYNIIYKGPSGQPAVVIIGLKSGNIHRLHVKLDDAVNNSSCYLIDTSQASGSTSVFTFEDCSAELGAGENNVGWKLGTQSLGGGDISQILWDNSTCWGKNLGYINGIPQQVKGQVGWLNEGPNTLQLTWSGGGYSFVETAVKATKSGTMYFFGFGGSQAKTDFDIQTANNFGVWGGRFEAGQRFLNVEQSANLPVFVVSGATISEYKPSDGIIFRFASPGSLSIEDVAIHRQNQDYDNRMITLSTPSSHPFGTFSISRGGINASDPFVTSNGFRVKIDNIVRLRSDYFQPMGYFTNK